MQGTRMVFRLGTLGLLVWLLLSAKPHPISQAATPNQSQIVQPDDVATPTPTSVFVRLPTPTPTWAARVEGRYVVQPDDTLWTVALEIGLDLQDVPCAIAPEFRIEQPLVIGNTLDVPPPGLRCHQVQPGETLESVAASYGLEPGQIRRVAWNRLEVEAADDSFLEPGSHLRIPAPAADEVATGGFMAYMLGQPIGLSPYVAYAVGGARAKQTAAPVPASWPFGSGNFTWPVYGWMSQGYRDDHRAVDIAAPVGSLVTAADRGVVVRAGWNDQGYGNFVVIDHNIDYVTLYSHLQDVFVREGDIVAQGAVLGTVGSTGNSTGPHLHFEIRDFGRRTNPIELLVR